MPVPTASPGRRPSAGERMNDRIESYGRLRVLLTAASVVVIVGGMRVAAPLLVPLAVALFLAIVSLPPLRFLRGHGVPRSLAILLIVLADAALVGMIGWIVLLSASQVPDAFPTYALRWAELEGVLLARLHEWGVEVTGVPYADLVQPERLLGLASATLLSLTNLASASLLVLLYLVFILGEASGVPGKLHAAIGARAGTLARLAPIVEEVQQYLALKTMISLATGVLIGAAAALLGVDFALFWGLLAFVLNFIPNIGSIMAAVPAVAVALLQLGPGTAALLAVVYLAVNLVIGNLLDPAIMGRRLGLSALVVMVSLAFWGWVWGIVGMLLAVPLTMAAKIALENTRSLRWIAVLLGPAAYPQPGLHEPGGAAPAAAEPLEPAVEPPFATAHP
jgi:AI-2 transport protein TqsA